MLIVFAFVLPLIGKIINIQFAFSIPFTWPLFYVLAGYYSIAITSRNYNMKYLVILIIALWGVIAIVNYFNFYSRQISAYDSPFIAILSIAIFTLFKKISISETIVLWEIDRLCFGVYLIHPLFIQFTYRAVKLTPISFENYFLMIPIFFSVFAFCSFLGSWILGKCSYLKKYVL